MTKPDKPEWLGCPVRYAAGIYGDKWSFILLRDILLHGKRKYREFLASDEQIATNILTDRLGKLTEAGMVTRHSTGKARSGVFYLPTQKACDLVPAFLEMMLWSVRHDPKTEAPDSFAASLESDRQGAVDWYLDQISKKNAEVMAEI